VVEAKEIGGRAEVAQGDEELAELHGRLAEIEGIALLRVDGGHSILILCIDSKMALAEVLASLHAS
jgi:hypothetical protein